MVAAEPGLMGRTTKGPRTQAIPVTRNNHHARASPLSASEDRSSTDTAMCILSGQVGVGPGSWHSPGPASVVRRPGHRHAGETSHGVAVRSGGPGRMADATLSVLTLGMGAVAVIIHLG